MAAALTGLSGWAEEASTDSTNARPWSVGVETSLLSQYLWRGLAYSAGWVVQPAVSVSAYDLTLCWWNIEQAGGELGPVLSHCEITQKQLVC